MTALALIANFGTQILEPNQPSQPTYQTFRNARVDFSTGSIPSEGPPRNTKPRAAAKDRAREAPWHGHRPNRDAAPPLSPPSRPAPEALGGRGAGRRHWLPRHARIQKMLHTLGNRPPAGPNQPRPNHYQVRRQITASFSLYSMSELSPFCVRPCGGLCVCGVDDEGEATGQGPRHRKFR